ncbi:MAG: helix-turn-helix domain-containing protein [Firmicutes bacterium]|nr:helix-turn-helix domain-containing protein [Bacillota bacterium]
MKIVGQRIKELREFKGVTQKDLSGVLGVRQHTISQFENGVRRPNYETLIALAKYFDVTVGQLLGTEDF